MDTAELERVTDVLRQKAKSTLHAFILVHANADGEGNRLYESDDMHEVLLFQVWLKACAELGIQCPPPSVKLT